MDPQAHREAAEGSRAGDLAPDFRLRDAKGGWVSLARTLEAGPAVLVFLGAVCVARTEPERLVEHQAEAAAQGATLLAISANGATRGLSDAGLSDAWLSDTGGAVSQAYGAPLGAWAAIHVVDRDGRIVLSCVEADPAGPLDLGEAMAALKALRSRGGRG